MVFCCVCGDRFNDHSRGVFLTLVSDMRSPKSGRPIPVREVFPNGLEEQFVCLDCVPYELKQALGLTQQGYDFPYLGEVPT